LFYHRENGETFDIQISGEIEPWQHWRRFQNEVSGTEKEKNRASEVSDGVLEEKISGSEKKTQVSDEKKSWSRDKFIRERVGQ